MPATVEVALFYDANGDRIQDGGENYASGIGLTLSAISGGSQMGTTDANGNYVFADVSPGSYAVNVSSPDGYTAEVANGSTNPFNIANESDEVGVGFGLEGGGGGGSGSGVPGNGPDNPWLVNTFADTSDGNLNDGLPLDVNGKVSLRAAVQQANFSGTFGGPKIYIGFDPVVFANVSTITLSSQLDSFQKNISVKGTGNTLLFINGGGTAGIMSVLASSQSFISGMTLQNGSNLNPQNTGAGGAISNSGTLSLDSIQINSCTANTGGAISNMGTLDMSSCSLINNQAPKLNGAGGFGGGIDNVGGSITISSSEIRGNSAGDRGGAISLRTAGSLQMTNTTITDNSSATFGGGLYNSGCTLSMTGGQLTGNTANLNDGGGMFHSGGNSSFYGVAIQNNTAVGRGGAIDARNGFLTLQSCAFANNQAAPGRGPKVAAGLQLSLSATGCQGFDPATDVYTGM